MLPAINIIGNEGIGIIYVRIIGNVLKTNLDR